MDSRVDGLRSILGNTAVAIPKAEAPAVVSAALAVFRDNVSHILASWDAPPTSQSPKLQ